jgi:hypothetical protein
MGLGELQDWSSVTRGCASKVVLNAFFVAVRKTHKERPYFTGSRYLDYR